jgi:hypothetical protein
MARRKKKLKLPPEDRGWPIMTSWQVRKWIDSSTALLYAHSEKTFEIKNETESVRASFFFTLKFDAAGNWKIARKCEVPDKGSGGLNKAEQEEFKRIREGGGTRNLGDWRSHLSPSALNSDPELKEEIDHMTDPVHLEE